MLVEATGLPVHRKCLVYRTLEQNGISVITGDIMQGLGHLSHTSQMEATSPACFHFSAAQGPGKI